MTAICLIDTSVFLEVLNVPDKAGQHSNVVQLLRQKIADGESLFLPMATIIETGNHIGQNGDGGQRRACAQRFIREVKLALEGGSPFKPVSFLTQEETCALLAEFEEHATRGSGLGDLSIIHDWRRVCAQNVARRVYIWSFDGHLAAYDQPPQL